MRATPELLRRRPRTIMAQTGEQLRLIPRVIFIVKGLLPNQTKRNSGPDVGHHMVTGVHGEVTHWSPNTSSGKQKRNRSTSQMQFRSENTPVTNEQTKSCWTFSSWQTTTVLQIFKTFSIAFPCCQSHSPQRCQRLTLNSRNLSCLKIFPNKPQNSQSVD